MELCHIPSMKLFVCVTLLAVAASAAPLSDLEHRVLFSKWMDQHGKSYSNGDEQAYRFGAFRQVCMDEEARFVCERVYILF